MKGFQIAFKNLTVYQSNLVNFVNSFSFLGEFLKFCQAKTVFFRSFLIPDKLLSIHF